MYVCVTFVRLLSPSYKPTKKTQNYGVSPVLAGYISSLMPLIVVICAPIAGLVLDRYGRQLDVLVACNVVTTLAYVLLLQVWVGEECTHTYTAATSIELFCFLRLIVVFVCFFRGRFVSFFFFFFLSRLAFFITYSFILLFVFLF